MAPTPTCAGSTARRGPEVGSLSDACQFVSVSILGEVRDVISEKRAEHVGNFLERNVLEVSSLSRSLLLRLQAN